MIVQPTPPDTALPQGQATSGEGAPVPQGFAALLAILGTPRAEGGEASLDLVAGGSADEDIDAEVAAETTTPLLISLLGDPDAPVRFTDAPQALPTLELQGSEGGTEPTGSLIDTSLPGANPAELALGNAPAATPRQAETEGDTVPTAPLQAVNPAVVDGSTEGEAVVPPIRSTPTEVLVDGDEPAHGDPAIDGLEVTSEDGRPQVDPGPHPSAAPEADADPSVEPATVEPATVERATSETAEPTTEQRSNDDGTAMPVDAEPAPPEGETRADPDPAVGDGETTTTEPRQQGTDGGEADGNGMAETARGDLAGQRPDGAKRPADVAPAGDASRADATITPLLTGREAAPTATLPVEAAAGPQSPTHTFTVDRPQALDAMPSTLIQTTQRAMQAGEASHRAIVRLDPPELGSITLEVTVVGDELSLVARTDSVEAGRALARQRADMALAIESLGMSLSEFDVQTGAGSQSSEERQGTRQQRRTTPDAEHRFDQPETPEPGEDLFL